MWSYFFSSSKSGEGTNLTYQIQLKWDFSNRPFDFKHSIERD